MANMTKDPAVNKFRFKTATLAPDAVLPNANFAQMEKNPNIKIVITVEADGTISSYNHPLTGAGGEEKLKNETGQEPYDVGQIWDLATLTLIIYGEDTPAGQPAKVEVGYWKTTSSGGRIMIS